MHKDTVVAAVRCVSTPRHHEVRSFPTTTAGLLALADWLAAHGCTQVAMEATGVYWKGHEAHLTGAGMKAGLW